MSISAGDVKSDWRKAPTADGWYFIAWEPLQGERWQLGDLVQLIDGVFYDEDGEEVERVFDPDLQIWVSANAADAYIPQAQEIELFHHADTGCAECARSRGPHYTGPCEH